MLKDQGYVFSGKYKPRSYKPDYMSVRSYKYVVATLLFSLGLWMLFYTLGVRV